jgi:hypothetical protein
MTRRAVVALAAVALAAGVFVSGAKAAPPLCGSRFCAEEIAVACAGLSGADFGACKKLVLEQCKISGETFCSCTNPALPPCTTGTTTTTTTTTTSTTTSTTTTTTSTSTTTTMSVGGAFLDFTTGVPGGVCGATRDGNGVPIKNLTCGGLNIGGGNSIMPEGLSPDGATSRFAPSCTGSSCTIGPTSSAPPVNTAEPDCTDTGCNFGTPRPLPNPTNPGLSICVLNTWSAPASGTLDLSSGTSTMNVVLNSDVYVTGNLAQPCPRCSATGSPSQPGMGSCDRGPRAGRACTTTSSTGLTRDCPTGGVGTVASPCDGGPGFQNCCPTPATCNCPCTAGGGNCCDGSHVGPISVTLSPLTTGTLIDTDPGGLFCPGQTAVGCFGSAACRTITENGVAAGPLTTDIPASATLAAVFCIPSTNNGLIDTAADLPGPGAVTLPGTFKAQGSP